MSKMWYAHTMEYYSACKRKEILTHSATWMNPEDMNLNEMISHLYKNHILYDSTYLPEVSKLKPNS